MGVIARHIEEVSPSGIREFFDLVLGMPEVISLGVGEPDFVAPWRIREKAITCLEEGMTSYTSNKGLFLLREIISQYLRDRYNLKYDPYSEILITAGVSEGLDLVLRALINPQDCVVVISPYYVAYPGLVKINHGRVIEIVTHQEDNFKINIRDLKTIGKYKPKAIILNYPSNPTGVTYSKEELEKIWKVIASWGTFIITDEVYEQITYTGRHYPFACLGKKAKERTILLNGFSKGWAMTGFRIGYVCGPKIIIDAMTKIHSYSALCTSIISQMAATEAFKIQREIVSMLQEYRRRRDFMVKELNRLGLDVCVPDGAFYCFPYIGKYKISAMDLARQLLLEEKVAVVPGTAFGSKFDRFIRISYANSLDNLKEAIVRIERFLTGLH